MAISGDKLYQDIIEDLKAEFPDFEIKRKSDSFFMKILNVLVIIFTFGAQKEFMKSYVSVISSKSIIDGIKVAVSLPWGG